MNPQELAQIKDLAQKHGIELQDQELVALVGVIESQVRLGIEQIEQQVDAIECDSLAEE